MFGRVLRFSVFILIASSISKADLPSPDLTSVTLDRDSPALIGEPENPSPQTSESELDPPPIDDELRKAIDSVNSCLLIHHMEVGSPISGFRTPDPLEPINRVMFEFNKGAIVILLKKVGDVYQLVVPEFVRQRIFDFGRNLGTPNRFLNDLFQGQFGFAFREITRFLFNSSIGLAGLFDVSTAVGYEAPPLTDFGKTLGHWGVGPGFYLVVPLTGPSNLRDFIADLGESFYDPLSLVNSNLPNIEYFIQYNEYMVAGKGRRYARYNQVVPDPYYDQKTFYDMASAALSCQK